MGRLGIPPNMSAFFGNPTICRGVVTCAARLDLYLLHLWACVTAARSFLHHRLVHWLALYIESTGVNITADYERPGVVMGNASRPGDLILYGLFSWLLGSDGSVARALIIDLKVTHPGMKSHVIPHSSDQVGGAATRASAEDKRRAFAVKIRADPTAVMLHQAWNFRPWIITPFGDMNDDMLEDLTEIARMIALHRLRGCFDEASRERAARKELSQLLSALSCAIQSETHDFLDARIRSCV